MNTNTLNNWIKIMFLAWASIAMVACDKNDN